MAQILLNRLGLFVLCLAVVCHFGYGFLPTKSKQTNESNGDDCFCKVILSYKFHLRKKISRYLF